MAKKKVKRYVCPLTGIKFAHSVDRDLWTELTQKEIEAKKHKLTKIEKK